MKNKEMKTVNCSLNELKEKINTYNHTKRVYVIYSDVLHKDALEDKKLINTIADNDKLYETKGNTIFFLRDCPIDVYKGILDTMDKHIKNKLQAINKLVPNVLIDIENNISYKVNIDDKELEYEIHNF